jgi:hypothetical protein
MDLNGVYRRFPQLRDDPSYHAGDLLTMRHALDHVTYTFLDGGHPARVLISFKGGRNRIFSSEYENYAEWLSRFGSDVEFLMFVRMK